MSAWIVSKAHIDVLTAGLVQHGFIKEEERATIGWYLWKENHASVNYRYSEHTKTPAYTPTTVPEGLRVGAVHIVAAVHCYNYQTCEHDDWEQSNARRFTMALLGAVSDLPTLVAHDKGTQGTDWQWGYDDLVDALEAVTV
jgi:hypothetical protein